MKRYLVILLAVLLIGSAAGCGTEHPPQTTEPPQTETIPAGSYEPDSQIEQNSSGAIRAFAPEVPDCRGFLATGTGLILFSGQEKTTLTVLEGENLQQTVQKTLNLTLGPEQIFLSPEGQGIAYYDAAESAVLILDETLRETRRIVLPKQILGQALLSPDWKTVYYATKDGLYALDLDSGLPRLIKQQTNDQETVLKLCFGGELLSCTNRLKNGRQETQYLQTENGAAIYSTPPQGTLYTSREVYFFPRQEGSVLRYGCGHWEEEPLQLTVRPEDRAVPVMALNGAAILRQAEDGQIIEFADLKKMAVTASVTVPSDAEILAAEGSDHRVWLLVSQDQKAPAKIWCWDLSASMLQEEIPCTVPFESWTQLDKEALHRFRDQASELGERFGVNILVATEVLTAAPEGYTLEPEYLTQAYQRDLEALEKGLSSFPEGFLAQAAEESGGNALTISLVRSYQSNTQAQAEKEQGLLYLDQDMTCILLPMGEGLQNRLYRTVSYLIDNRVLGKSLVYDDWEKLNPAGFAYDYNNETNQSGDNGHYLEDESRAFIDEASMSFPREDRARILEYAMTPDCGSYFQSEIMQKKLHTICVGIRESFELPEGNYLWEQYLKSNPTEAE